MIKTLIYFDEKSPESSVELLQAARCIAGDKKGENYLISFHSSAEEVAQYFNFYIDASKDNLEQNDIVNKTNSIQQLYEKYNFDCILFPATYIGRMLAPRLAMRLGVGLVADVTDISYEDGKAQLVRPAFDGKIFATIVNAGKAPLMASIRPQVFKYEGSKLEKSEKIYHGLKEKSKTTLKCVKSTSLPEVKDIRDAKVIVSGGGGVSKYFDKLEPLAKALGGMVGVSRRIVDSGIASRTNQVGQSGKIVSPKLYIALGIYGSLQHVEGLKDVEYIISVNTNKYAPICSLSDIVVEGDAEEFIEMLSERIQRQNSDKSVDIKYIKKMEVKS